MNSAPLLLLYLILHNIKDVLTRQCWQGPMYSEMVVAPVLRSSSILRVPEVLTLAQCVGACCDLPGCNLAWFFNRQCYILSCQKKENCQPKRRPGTDSQLAFLQRRRPQTLVLQSLVRGEPYASQWRPLTRRRGPENPLRDLALLEDIQDLDNNAMEYDESYKTVEDNISEERSASNLEQDHRTSQGPLDWALDERSGFNFSEVEGGKIKLSLLESTEGTQVTPSSSPTVTNESITSLGPVEPSQSEALGLPTVKDEEDQFNISFMDREPTVLPDMISADMFKPSPDNSSFPSLPNVGSSTSLPSVKALVVSIGDVDDITLPENVVKLTASVESQTETEKPYTYEWSFVSSPIGHPGVMEGKNKSIVKVSELSAGIYVVNVSVIGDQAYGESVVNITVHPEFHVNMPPKSVVLPKHQEVSSSVNTIIFINGSQSSDDSGIVSYMWEQVDGPLWTSDGPMNTPVLKLQNSTVISSGDYVFRLMVVDSEGLSDSTNATVKVSSPKDEPPVAIAGTNQIIRLPLNHLTLWANQSTDDHAINSFQWSFQPNSTSKSATIQGATSSALQLSDLQEGVYTFQLTVTDSIGQKDTDIVSVSVLAANRAPVAVAGPDRELVLPVASLTLNGSDSTDDQAITSYQWEILSGPPGSEIMDASTAVTLVTGLRAGSYRFRLMVQDEQGASGSTILTVTVKEAESWLLTAHASGSHTLTLPNNSLVLKGSVSNCVSTNVSFLWVRDEQSPAAGDILFGSDHEATLYLANLVEGTYLFQLRVSDSQGRSNTAMATVEVRPDVREREEVELELQVPLAQVSQQQKAAVVRQLAALLHVLDADITLKGLHSQSDISTIFRFSVQGPDGTFPGPKLARLLRYQLLKEKTDYLLFKVLRVDTVMCLLLCSGHGQCDPITRSCSCDPLWLENPFRRFLDDERNCDWSVLYVTVCCLVVIIFLVSSTWAWCKRSRRTKVRKKTKYTILDNMDEQERMELRPKYTFQPLHFDTDVDEDFYDIKHRSTEHNSSLMMSESEIDSEQDTIFSYERTGRARNRANGAMMNGDRYSLQPVEG